MKNTMKKKSFISYRTYEPRLGTDAPHCVDVVYNFEAHIGKNAWLKERLSDHTSCFERDGYDNLVRIDDTTNAYAVASWLEEVAGDDKVFVIKEHCSQIRIEVSKVIPQMNEDGTTRWMSKRYGSVWFASAAEAVDRARALARINIEKIGDEVFSKFEYENEKIELMDSILRKRRKVAKAIQTLKCNLSDPDDFQKWADALDCEQKSRLQSVLEADDEMDKTLYFEK